MFSLFHVLAQQRCSCFPEVSALPLTMFARSCASTTAKATTVGARLWLSHERDWHISGPVLRPVKRAPVHVLLPVQQHVVVKRDHVIVDRGLSFRGRDFPAGRCIAPWTQIGGDTHPTSLLDHRCDLFGGHFWSSLPMMFAEPRCAELRTPHASRQ